MLAIGGLVFLFICVFGVYAATGGMEIVLHALPHEMATIGGAAVGTFLISNSAYGIKHALKDMAKVIKGAKFKKSDYMDILTLMFQLLKLARTRARSRSSRISKSRAKARFSRLIPRSCTTISRRT